MAMILRNQDSRSEVQSKVAAELQGRLNAQRQIDHKTTDPAFLEKQHGTRLPGVLIVILMLVLLAVIIWAVTKI